MLLEVSFETIDGAPQSVGFVSLDFRPVPRGDRKRFYAWRAHKKLPVGDGPSLDVIVWAYHEDADDNKVLDPEELKFEVIVLNGSFSNPLGLVEGILRVEVLKIAPSFQSRSVKIHDGCGEVVRFGRLGRNPDQSLLKSHFLHGAEPSADLINYLQSLKPFADVYQNTGQKGSPRLIVGRSPHALATHLGFDDHCDLFHDWVDVQIKNRQLHYVEDDATPWSVLARTDTKVGWGGTLNSGKNKHGRQHVYSPPTGWSWAWDPQHATWQHEWLCWLLTGSEAARFAAECGTRACLSEDAFRNGTGEVTNTRNDGWPLQAFAWALELTRDVTYQRGITSIVQRLERSIGMTSVDGYNIRYPGLAPARPDHGNCQICVWQTAVLLRGLGDVLESYHRLGATYYEPAFVDRVLELHQWCLVCVAKHGRMPDPEGDKPKTFWKDYDEDGRVNGKFESNSGQWFHGTTAWIGPALVQSIRLWPQYRQFIEPMAHQLYFGADQMRAGYSGSIGSRCVDVGYEYSSVFGWR